MKIINVSARKILASFGNDTVEAVMVLENGKGVSASVPAGISAGKYEVAKVRADEAINQIGQISQIVTGKNWTQETLDEEISRHNFGGNATLAVSAAFFKATTSIQKPVSSFPRLMLLFFEGGKHGNLISQGLTIQEFSVLEDSIASAEDSFKKLRDSLLANKIETLVGAEGGFSPLSFDNTKALDTIKTNFAEKQICLDAADCFQQGVCPDYDQIIANYNIASIEDPFSDEDWDKWVEFMRKYADKVLIVGDDLTTTNPDRIKKAINLKAINAAVIKPNQIGTISAAFDAVKVARAGGLKIVVSHRGEETDDDWIVDFALAVNADYVKFGGMDRGERVAKYNRLKELGMA